jgi:hypothetical protein
MVNGWRAAAKPDSLAAEFDDDRLIANAGLVLTAMLCDRLGIERLVDETVELGERPGAARPGRKVLSLVHAMAAGADSIDDCDLLRRGDGGRPGPQGDGPVDARAPSCARSASGMCVSSTGCWVRPCGEPGRWARARVRGGW